MSSNWYLEKLKSPSLAVLLGRICDDDQLASNSWDITNSAPGIKMDLNNIPLRHDRIPSTMSKASRNRSVAFALVFFALLSPEARSGEELNRNVRIKIDTEKSIAKVSEEFIGFGYETSAVAQPGFFTRDNARMINLYGNLSKHGMIRIGGNVSDHTRYIADGLSAAKTEKEVSIINRTNLNDLREFVRATGWCVMWGLNLGTGTKEVAAEEAMAVNQALGANLHSFELGNEVDLLPKYSKDYVAYHRAFADYKAAIRSRLPNAVFSGPDSAGNLEFIKDFVAEEAADMKLVTQHYYRSGARKPEANMDYLLARDKAFGTRLNVLQELCGRCQLEYRINEVNSFYGGGKQGVSDAFGSALWCLDFMLNLAAHGCNGINLQTDVNQLGFISFYSPIVHDDTGACTARPEYYGMLAFAMVAHGDLLKTSFDAADINVAAYCSRDIQGTYYVTVINKESTLDVSINCSEPDGITAVEAYRLCGPALGATKDVTFSGSAVAEDGTWSPLPPETVSTSAGEVRCSLPHASAIVLKFRHD
jgi:hypothetical protein